MKNETQRDTDRHEHKNADRQFGPLAILSKIHTQRDTDRPRDRDTDTLTHPASSKLSGV